ncbi:pyruvate dehydrogenase [Armillaria luteobubalina]|uniref:3-methyl-2-oxobutanoate dehydrogenase (2-methylpropanoyl-transferring) n=1 Tax=Armillaria luteobubalina TaxID=153913 RepID=A0AA39QJQ8_9AGAR|nr:pyruvate dehydrogenase [Armillaria luteobubalina]
MLAHSRVNALARCVTRYGQLCRCYSAEAAVEPPPAGGHLPSIATSSLLRPTRDLAIRTPGLVWTDEDGSGPSRSIVGGRETRKMNLYQAVRDAMSVAMSKDDHAVVFGEDVAFGGVFRCTMGLAEEFGRERVFNTPLTEQGIVGFEIQFADYIFPAFDQLVNEAAKIRYRSGGSYNVGGLTVRAPTMAVGHGGLYHSQSPKASSWALPASKLSSLALPFKPKVYFSVLSATPTRSSSWSLRFSTVLAVEQVPTDDFTLPVGRAETLIPGSDLTLLTWGTPVYHCEAAMHMLASPTPEMEEHAPAALRKARVELIDLRTVLPWDIETVVESVNRTGRLVVVHEAGMTGGVGAEICAQVQQRCFLKLDAPVKRVTGWDTPVALQYEKFHIPDALRVFDAIVETLSY